MWVPCYNLYTDVSRSEQCILQKAKSTSLLPSITHESVDVLRDDSDLGKRAGKGGNGLVAGVGSLPREADRKVLEEELVVPAKGVAEEHGAPALCCSGDTPYRVAPSPKGWNTWSEPAKAH